MEEVKKYSEWEYEDDADQGDGQSGKDDQGQNQSDGSQEGGDDSQKKSPMSDDSEIEVNGEKITLAEVKKGYMRQSDYTKKTQELSEKEKSIVEEKSKKVLDNPEDYPAEDVKAAEYFMKIAKSKFGLMTREEYDAEESKKNQIREVEQKLKDASTEVGKMEGMPEFVEDEVIEHMRKTGIHHPLAAYKDLHEAEFISYKMKLAKGDTSYRSEKNGERIEKKKKEYKKGDAGDREFLMDELVKMKD